MRRRSFFKALGVGLATLAAAYVPSKVWEALAQSGITDIPAVITVPCEIDGEMLSFSISTTGWVYVGSSKNPRPGA